MTIRLDDAAALLSRRRLLALAAGAVVTSVAAGPSRRMVAQGTPVASPAAAPAATAVGTPAAATPSASFPLPTTLAADASPEFRAVAEALVAAMRQLGVPGAALGILTDGREEHATFGVASLSSLAPVTPETLFQIGSLSKTYTATAIWRLIDNGALALDAPVRTYLPELRVQDEQTAAAVTVGNLLDHTAGWYGDDTFDTGSGDDAVARFVAERMPNLPQLFPLGAFFSYNNVAFTLLGRLIEVATGTTYNAAMASLLLDPLGLNDSLLDHAAVLARPYADGHIAGPINGQPTVAVQTPLWVPRSVDPAGGIWSTTRDAIRYARFHLPEIGGGGATGAARVVQPGSLAQMQEPAVAIPGMAIQMGRDWFVQDLDGVRAIMHSGDTMGHHTEFVAIPGRGFAFVLLTNGQPGGTLAAAAVLDAALAAYPGLAPLAGRVGLTAQLLVPPGTPTVALPPEQVAEYAGRYAIPAQVITLTPKDGALEQTTETIVEPGSWQPAIQMPTAPARIDFLAPDVGVVDGVARLPFVRDAAGRVGWMSVGLRLIPRVGPV